MAAIVSARAGVPGWRAGLRSVLAVTSMLLPLAAMSGCAWLDAKQSQLALRPTPGRPANLPDDSVLFRPGDQRFSVAVPAACPPAPAPGQPQASDQLALWWLPNADPQAPTLLYLHGTFRNLYQNLSKINALRDAGFAIVAVDYRGWGDSTPITPDEETIAADARVAWAELQRRQPDARRRVIFGHSMGGAVAVRLASTLHGPDALATAAATAGAAAAAPPPPDYAALALESTFTRLPEVAAAAGFWGRVAARVTTLEFDSRSRIARIDAPVLMLHGDADNTVPVALGRGLRDAALQAAAKTGLPKLRWVEFAGGSHSQLHAEQPQRYAQTFRDLIAGLPGTAPAAVPDPPPSPRTP
jgi:pimeloyl-ACP methyl ester carboxylesterase